LYAELFHEDQYDILLREDPATENKRRIANEQLEALKKAKKIIQNHERTNISSLY